MCIAERGVQVQDKAFNKRQIGADYELVAANYLEQKGYIILERNYRNPYGEIDLIALDGDTVVFCEIKYRKKAGYGSPLSAVDVRKQRRISKVALYYTAGYQAPKNVFYRFDVIGIDGDNTIEHIENAFYFQR